ncbi:hypothetical protein BDM02DRAFT_3193395 [Thelephora ganbajun]|uniref:Uncharacterized protein n=1 Tax=Thelephora ganbajun TaxID=370292 RepID=A0ACB6YYJ7_THEGA|nr:hypothetical protein BDM02DRAFT_3193395 [Thelephora ganbajun]
MKLCESAADTAPSWALLSIATAVSFALGFSQGSGPGREPRKPLVTIVVVFIVYIAKKLSEINERRAWKDPDAIPSSKRTWEQRCDTGENKLSSLPTSPSNQPPTSFSIPSTTNILQSVTPSEETFQTARLINYGWFGFVVFSGRETAALGLVRRGDPWGLDPFNKLRPEDHDVFEWGRGNFNCLYRWHATTSEEDERWVGQLTTRTVAAEKLYGTIDHLGLYADLQTEETEPVIESVGLRPGYTISHAIIADAVALIRGYRLLTADFTPHNLTPWGFADCVRSPGNP